MKETASATTKAHAESSFDITEAHRKPNTALRDYAVQLFNLETQNKKRLLRARAEQGHLVEGNLQYETTIIADNKGSLRCEYRGTVSDESTVVCENCATRQHTRYEYGVTHVSEVQEFANFCWICYPGFGGTARTFFLGWDEASLAENYLINQTPGEKFRHGVTLRLLSQSNYYTLVLQSPEPIILHREAFLPESLRAYGPPLYTNSKFLVRRQLFDYNAVS